MLFLTTTASLTLKSNNILTLVTHKELLKLKQVQNSVTNFIWENTFALKVQRLNTESLK